MSDYSSSHFVRLQYDNLKPVTKKVKVEGKKTISKKIHYWRLKLVVRDAYYLKFLIKYFDKEKYKRENNLIEIDGGFKNWITSMQNHIERIEEETNKIF